MKYDVAPLREERHSVSSLQTHVPREPHVCGSDGFIFISVAHLSFLPISNAVIDLNDIALSHCFEFHFILK